MQAVLADEPRLQLVFQPIVDLAGAVVAGHEALARFADPTARPAPRPPTGGSPPPTAAVCSCGGRCRPTPS
ncbi:hypothetical protein [Kineococcus sp. SYSU DK003]|uniref:hypothetical protein n=1 Tax=Kineococcus sp. SYSU DK003 TaxID=3383124 RepID=UPI003D7E8626